MENDNIRDRLKNYGKFENNIKPCIPKNALIELSNLCNHECIFCANSKMTRKRGEINKDFLYKILKELYESGVREVGFYATGEPFVNKHIFEYIQKAKEIGFDYIYITTNGALLNKETIIKTIISGLDSIKFSINAGTEKTYKIMHGKDDFNKVIDNVRFISEYRSAMNCDFKIYVSYVVTPQNVSEKELIEDLLGDLVDDIVFMNARNQGGLMYEINDKLVFESEKYKKNMAFCSLPFNAIHITYEGYLTACCIDFQNYLVVADLNKQALKDAWLNEEFIKLREKHLENKLEGTLCYNCIYNVKEDVNPLIQQFATEFNYEDYTKKEEIMKRLDGFYEERPNE